METTKAEITMAQISELLRSFPPARDDARVWAMRDLVNEYEQYTEKLEWLSRNLADEVLKNQTHGVASVYETVLSTSLIPDIGRHAAKIAALRNLLQMTCKPKDDPAATVVDELIHTLRR